MQNNRNVVVLYSGGTDSTCVVLLEAKNYEQVHLLSYNRFGIFNTENIKTNITKLKLMFSENKFIIKNINIDKIYKFISYKNYFSNLLKYGLFNLSSCTLCKLSMHIRTIVYCIDNNINVVLDGSNKYSGESLATDQIEEVINSIKDLYSSFNISYITPVYNMKAPKEKTWLDKINNTKQYNNEITTGTILKEKKFFDTENIKGTKQDKKMQARCFQQFISNIALKYYFINRFGIDTYKNNLKEFCNSKTELIKQYIKDYSINKKTSKLYKYIDYEKK